MPCNSDYLAPNQKEKNSQEVAQHLVYLSKNITLHLDSSVIKAAKDSYGNSEKLNQMVFDLCNICRSLTKEERDKYIYNGHNKDARALANWWDKHLEADEAREYKEEKIAKEKSIREIALSKLSYEEKRILGLNK